MDGSSYLFDADSSKGASMIALSDKPRVIVSACLLGNLVRFNGQHSRDRFVSSLHEFLEIDTTCPEVEAGMGIPREPIRIVQDGGTRVVGLQTSKDYTELLEDFSSRKVDSLRRQPIDGFIMKQKSPSCGLFSVKNYLPNGHPQGRRAGVFGEQLMENFHHVPIEEEGRLNDPLLRESFLMRVYAHHRLRGLFAGAPSAGEIVAFHSKEKLLLLAHCQRSYRHLGRMVSNPNGYKADEFKQEYVQCFMEALGNKYCHKNHVNVIQHCFGYVKDDVTPETKHHFLKVLNEYSRQIISLSSILGVLESLIAQYQVDYLKQQTYFSPYPQDLKLRNFTTG